MARIRKQYRDVIARRLREGGLRPLLEGGLRLLGTRVSAAVRRPLTGPVLATLIITYRCNYSCEFCDLPQRAGRWKRAGRKEFGREAMLEVIRGFRRIGASAVGITGGEPFLRDDLFDVLAGIRRAGMVGHVNTNGHFLTPDRIERLLSCGAESLNVSVDSPEAAVHDRIRGRRGSHETIRRGIGALLARRRQGRPRIGLTTVLTESTIGLAPEMLRFARELGVDSAGFIPLHEYREDLAGRPLAPLREFSARAREVIDAVRREADGFVENSDGYLSLFARCFSGRLSGLRCYAPWNSMVVDCYGRVFPCVPLSEVEEPILTIAPDGVPAAWRSDAYARKRAALRHCQACYWNCHTEMNLLYQRPPRDEA